MSQVCVYKENETKKSYSLNEINEYSILNFQFFTYISLNWFK